MDNTPRILIVDDERQNIKVLTRFLREPYKIMAAKNGNQALKAAGGSIQPDLILLDIMMPGIDGYEVCRQLKNNKQTRNIPVIFITALDAAGDEAKGFELGAVDFITKPFHPIVVKARVNTHIQLKQKTDLLKQMAALDGLTKIPNRRSFDTTLDKELRRSTRNGSKLSLIMIDIDYFKKYNDCYGHSAGDACIKQVAKTIAEKSRRASDFAARYGGEEFAVVLAETDHDGAMHVAESIRLAVADLNIPHTTSDAASHVTISIGAATVEETVEPSAVHLIKNADTALYRSKEKGRNRISHFSKI